MNSKTGKEFFGTINRRAMQISREQGTTKGLAKGSKIQAARELFIRIGSPGGDFESWWGEVHKHGTAISTNPDAIRRRNNRQMQKGRIAKKSEQNNASPALVARYLTYIEEHDGTVPLDWVLLREWTDVTATELRHARKSIIDQGYVQSSKSKGHYAFFPPSPPDQDELPTASVSTSDGNNVTRQLDYDSANHDELVAELRRIAGLLANIHETNIGIKAAVLGNSLRLDTLIQSWE